MRGERDNVADSLNKLEGINIEISSIHGVKIMLNKIILLLRQDKVNY
jgi:hypothetical protein